jgi:predicted SnoaL-like aldol condensation-catalyzing enzyme
MKILRFKFPLLGLACWLLLAGMPQAQAADATGEANKKIVLAFYDAALVKFDAELARQYLGDKYIQHNPTAPDGVEGVMGLIKFLKEKFPLRKSDVKRWQDR